MVRISKKNLKIPKAPPGAVELPSENRAKSAPLTNDKGPDDTTHAPAENVQPAPAIDPRWPFLDPRIIGNQWDTILDDLNRVEKIKCFYDNRARYDEVVARFPEQRHFRDYDQQSKKVSKTKDKTKKWTD